MKYNILYSERDLSAKFEKRHPGIATQPHAPPDLDQRESKQDIFSGPSARSDLSTLIGHPLLGRGRGQSSGPGSSVETLDFASPLAPQVAAPPQSTTMEILTGLWMLPTDTEAGLWMLPTGYQSFETGDSLNSNREETMEI